MLAGEAWQTQWKGKMGALDQPVTAAVLGVIAGLGIVGILLIFPKLAKPSNPMGGMAASFAGVLASTLVGIVVLYVYSTLADGGFVWFGVSTVTGYFVGLMIYTVVVIRSK